MSTRALWIGDCPLVLASGSPTRATLLHDAGVVFEVVAADIDERAVEAPLLMRGEPPAVIAAHLARVKALAVSTLLPDRLVLGADQVLALDGERFTKPESRDAARTQLLRLSGRRHALHSAAALASGGKTMEEMAQTATLTVRRLGADFIERYLDAAGSAVSASVGGYQLEGLGVQLFTAIEGDHFTVLGLPLLPLLDSLRRRGLVAA